MTKTELFHQDLQTTALVFKVLGHPARLSILKYLAETSVCISGDISRELPLSRTTVNQHLKVLKQIGLIKGEIEGVKVNYCLDAVQVDKLNNVINKYLDSIRTDDSFQKC